MRSGGRWHAGCFVDGMTNVAVIYYSSTGTNEKMARAVVRGAQRAGAETRLCLAEENAPRQAIEGMDGWKRFVEKHKDDRSPL